MEKFLKETAFYILSKYEDILTDTALVFPNRRSGLFFQKYLSSFSSKPFFSPPVYTISDLVGNVSGLLKDDEFSLIVDLWKTYCEITSSTETLDDFYYRGEILLQDFNDIDKYLVDAEKLFKNIKSLKDIDYGFDFLSEDQLRFLSGFWDNILRSRDSKNKQEFVNIWSKLFDVYSGFRLKLKADNRSYEGMQYREMTEKLKTFPDFKYKKFAFIGFNALNKCEFELFNYLKINYSADFFWDFDDYYMSKEFHEASLFMKLNLKFFPPPEDFDFSSDNFSKIEALQIVSVPGFSGQASYVPEWLDENNISKETEFDNTAIVLCDESMLLPMLNNLPSGLGNFNITMGFPVRNLPVFGLIKSLAELDGRVRKIAGSDNVFYYRDVQSVFSNSLIASCSGGDFISNLLDSIQNEGKIYLSEKDFSENEFLYSVFSIPETLSEIRTYLQRIILSVFSSIEEDQPINKESIFQVYNSINIFFDSILKVSEGVLISKKLLYQLLIKKLEQLSIPFEGEPLKGIQIMGFLETRCLDFENIILLSFNDDKLPGRSNQSSFIPYSLRKGFGMPASEQKNAMYSYYFYRLIQRAKNISMVFDSRTEGMSRGEVSRYLNQIKFEAKSIKINEINAFFESSPFQILPINISKDDKTLEAVISYLTSKTVSPTALNTYLFCKLKFYLRYIKGIREKDEISEDIDNMLFGRIAHKAMENLYLPFVGKQILPEEICLIINDKKRIEKTLRKSLEEELFKGNNFKLNGNNLIVFEIIKKYIYKILEYDKATAPFELISLEENYKTSVEIEADGFIRKISIGGKVDRIDKVGDVIRVIDYKTGASDLKIKNIDDLFKEENNNGPGFQTMLYSLSVYESLKPMESIIPGIYGATTIFTKEFSPEFKINGENFVYQVYADDFKKGVEHLLKDILNPEITFSQRNKNDKCGYCEFNTICKK